MQVSRFPIKGSALVTGASRGIGRTVALRLADGGISVAVNYRQSREEAHQVVEEIRARGVDSVALHADMASVADVCDLVARTEDALGPLGILVNNAGITRDRLTVQMSEEDWDATWFTDLVGPRTLALRALDAMCSHGRGRIINVGSVVGSTGNAGQANYATAKSALLGVTRELAVRAAPRGITVNCVVPGYIITDATAHLNEDQRNTWMRRIPMGRFAFPEEVADIIAFLTGESAGYVTGQCIAVDGGYLAAAGGYLSS
ncbi:MAG: 3-oxoacyl-[acyl-carrier-protein] reductase [Chloroflexota bacterium]